MSVDIDMAYPRDFASSTSRSMSLAHETDHLGLNVVERGVFGGTFEFEGVWGILSCEEVDPPLHVRSGRNHILMVSTSNRWIIPSSRFQLLGQY